MIYIPVGDELVLTNGEKYRYLKFTLGYDIYPLGMSWYSPTVRHIAILSLLWVMIYISVGAELVLTNGETYRYPKFTLGYDTYPRWG